MKRYIKIILSIVAVAIPYCIFKLLIFKTLDGNSTIRQSNSEITEWESDSTILVLDPDGEYALYKSDTIIYGNYYWKTSKILELFSEDYHEKIDKLNDTILRRYSRDELFLNSKNK